LFITNFTLLSRSAFQLWQVAHISANADRPCGQTLNGVLGSCFRSGEHWSRLGDVRLPHGCGTISRDDWLG
jgi:hypothetical protein